MTSVMQSLLILAACISQLLIPPSRAAFTFTLDIQSHTTTTSCSDPFNSNCDTAFPFFCLREPSSSRLTDSNNCNLGRNSETLENGVASGTRQISSNQPWPGAFQLFIEAVDEDIGSPDDHIEYIFVEESLAANSGASPSRTYGSGVRLTMTFQVDCQTGYFGPACTCQPMNDDTNGHFTCNPADGSRVCLQDYYGEDCLTLCQPSQFYSCNQEDGSRICTDGFTNPGNGCSENIDDCDEQPCENQGNCTDLVADYSCACSPGYTGKNCSVDINECLDADCPGNSTCSEDAPGSFQCSCNPGFEGENCTEIDLCRSSPCANDGVCISASPFEFSCVCGSGFTGPTCEEAVVVQLSSMCGGVATCPQGSTCLETENGVECLPTTSNTTGVGKSVVVIASVLGAIVAIIILLILVILICLCSRKRISVHKAGQRLSHVYEASPTSSNNRKLGSKPGSLDDDMALNPIYNQPSPSHHGMLSSGSVSPVIHEVQNCLYESNPNQEMAVYEQVGTNFSTLESTLASPNIAYAPGRSKGQECIDNPVYSVTTSMGSETDPPLYSVPRPVDPTTTTSSGGEGKKGGYAPLSNSSTPSHASSSSTTPPPNTSAGSQDEGMELLEGKKTSGTSDPTTRTRANTASESDSYYATPTSAVAVATGPARRSSKESSLQYSKLEHHADATNNPRPVRLALDSNTGYQALQNN